MRTAEYPRPSRVIAHFSDTHLRDPADPLVRGVVDPRPHLVAALDAAAAHAPEAIVLTGDLSDDGSFASYLELRRIVEPAADRMGAQVIWVNGNHDDREAFSEVLLGGSTREPLHQAHHLGGLRVLCLDTTVPGEDAGEVTAESLAWLADQLAQPAPEGTILAMHHAPLPVVQDLAASWELHGQTTLSAVLAGSDVRAILAGHFHQSGFGTLAGVPVHAATSLCYTQDLATGRGLRGTDGAQAWHLVRVHAHTVTSTVAPLGHHPTVVAERSAEESAAELTRRGIRIEG
ncbi:MAG: metallophosphoesterase [Propionicimonas sp.]|uniref:metallophosphoesterase n=1 Tax=Propionicimonas sp. TaxID=1955623 RepID=UPI003D0B4AE1